MLTPDRKGPYWEMWKLEVCFCLQLAAGLQRCCNPFMHQYWLQCCKCSKKWIDQEGPGSQTWVPCVKGFKCCHEGGPAQFCRQCAAKVSLANERVAGKTETGRASHCWMSWLLLSDSHVHPNTCCWWCVHICCRKSTRGRSTMRSLQSGRLRSFLCMTDTCWHILQCLVPVHIV